MTAKRFGMYQNTLYDDGDILNPFDAMKLLNYFDKENTKLKEENEQLKKEMGDLGTAHAEEINKIEDGFDEEILKLEKENEQLKQQEKRLYKYFRKCFENVSEQGFREVWEVVKNND